MVLLGGLELVAAGYLIHQHQKNKKERSLLEEESYPLQEDGSHRHSRRKHSRERRRSRDRRHGRSYSCDEEGHHRRHRSESRDRRRRREKEEYVPRPGRGRESNAPMQTSLAVPPQPYGRQNSAPPGLRPPPAPAPAKHSQPGYPPTGWPQHWEQNRTGPPAPVAAFAAQPRGQAPPAPRNHGFPADVKYGFNPSVPHAQYSQPPPAYQPSASTSQPNLAPPQANMGVPRDDRSERRRRRGRSDAQRSVSPNLGLYDEEDERFRPNPRVRFAVDNRIPGDGAGVRSPPPEYRA